MILLCVQILQYDYFIAYNDNMSRFFIEYGNMRVKSDLGRANAGMSITIAH